MKTFSKLVLTVVVIVLLMATPLLAGVVEPVYKVNIPSVTGKAGSGHAKAQLRLDEGFEMDMTDLTFDVLWLEIGYHVSDMIAAGVAVPWVDDGDDSEMGDVVVGGHFVPITGEFNVAAGVNVALPTESDDPTIDPYIVVAGAMDAISITASGDYALYMDSDANADVLTLQASALFSVDMLAVGAQVMYESWDDLTLISLVPQVKVKAGPVEVGVAYTLAITDDDGVERSNAIAGEVTYVFGAE